MKISNSLMFIDVINDPDEGENQIKYIIPLKMNRKKVGFFVILSILSLGLWPLVIYWNPKILKDVIYDEISIEKSSHFYIIFKSKYKMIV